MPVGLSHAGRTSNAVTIALQVTYRDCTQYAWSPSPNTERIYREDIRSCRVRPKAFHLAIQFVPSSKDYAIRTRTNRLAMASAGFINPYTIPAHRWLRPTVERPPRRTRWDIVGLAHRCSVG